MMQNPKSRGARRLSCRESCRSRPVSLVPPDQDDHSHHDHAGEQSGPADRDQARMPTVTGPASRLMPSVIEAVARDPRLCAFIGHGRIETLPARQSRRRLLLDKIAQAFEPGVQYSERRVNLFLGAVYGDYAALRRYLVDAEFLSRSDGQYWRSGGTVPSSPADELRDRARASRAPAGMRPCCARAQHDIS
jgi:hypothetical protein